jgi:hypothetical protein
MAEDSGPIPVISADGKGVVIRPEDLRGLTRMAAEARNHFTPRATRNFKTGLSDVFLESCGEMATLLRYAQKRHTHSI